MRFIDEAEIIVRSGKGGNGCVSFRREKFIPRGGPDGGDGGRGGDVIFRASPRLLTLYDFRLKRIYEARNGQPGMGKQRYGQAADNLVLDLPPGTLVHELHEDGDTSLLADLTAPGQEVVVCKGGRGGRGNIHFKSSTNRAPRQSEPGFPGEEKRLRLELKILAHAGIIGLPNAGKSTFISAMSRARPKIAPYPFTTLSPNLGVMDLDCGEQLVMADIPGLIEGAGQGKGLGHDFLKHVERTRFLVHLAALDEADPDDPMAAFDLVNAELEDYDPELAQKPQILVFNKLDALAPDALEGMRRAVEASGREVHFISALQGRGLEAVAGEMEKAFKRLDSEEATEEHPQP